MKKVLLFFLAPLLAKAQEVQPVLSAHYQVLIKKDSSPWHLQLLTDTTNSFRKAKLATHFTQYLNYNGIYVVQVKGNRLYVKPKVSEYFFVGGNFNSTVELRTINSQPALQSTYVQGGPENGNLQWRGPETGEMFSYGPALQSLEFDGSNYAYDVAGRLVTKGSGNGRPALPYANSIFRKGYLLSQSLALHGRYLVGSASLLKASLNLGRSNEGLYIKSNSNSSQNMSARVEGLIKSWLFVTAQYASTNDRFSNINRNGFLNRVYQNALLSPASFDNAQEVSLGSRQRSYSTAADNPFYLLENNRNNFLQSHRTGSLSFERRQRKLKFKLLHSLERLQQVSSEGLPVATAFFPDGAYVLRKKSDANYNLAIVTSYDFRSLYGDLASTIKANYLYGNNNTSIQYQPGNYYQCQRSSNDITVSYNGQLKVDDVTLGLIAGNKAYFSNTSSGSFFLPDVAASLQVRNIFDSYNWDVKASYSFNRFLSEVPVSMSFSQANLLRYNTEDAFQFFPVTEATGLNNVSPIQHTEKRLRLEMNYRYRFVFSAELFKRVVKNDVYPVLQNNQLQFMNLADHQNTGLELEAKYNTSKRFLNTSHSLSFITTQARVNAIKDGYDFTPIAGFNNVHKALVNGDETGAIVGSRFSRDGQGRIIIGSDGFPVVDAEPAVVGRPIPDFTMKTNHALYWKALSLHVDVEWRKGGDIWNGTQAVLDYYGRSKTSADMRNVTGYVFDGVNSNGHVNTAAVDFYNPSLPLQQNRWVRYGHSGVAEAYIQKGDHVRLNNVSLSYKFSFRKYLQSLTLSGYINNILLWSAYKGADPGRILYDQANTSGLDFFNLPSIKSFGCNLSIQF